MRISDWSSDVCSSDLGRFGKPGSTDAFTRKYIFPGGYIPALSETVAASEKSRLIVTDVERLRLHYARTLRQWYAHPVAHRNEITRLMDEPFLRMGNFYPPALAPALARGGMANTHQTSAPHR